MGTETRKPPVPSLLLDSTELCWNCGVTHRSSPPSIPVLLPVFRDRRNQLNSFFFTCHQIMWWQTLSTHVDAIS